MMAIGLICVFGLVQSIRVEVIESEQNLPSVLHLTAAAYNLFNDKQVFSHVFFFFFFGERARRIIMQATCVRIMCMVY